MSGAVHIFMFFGTLTIAGMSALLTYFSVTHSAGEVDNPYVPTVLAGVIGYIVALAFANVFDMTSDTLLYCYGLDEHDGTSADTAPPALRRLIHNKGGGGKA